MSCKWERCSLDKLVLLQRGHDLSIAKRGKGSIPVAGSNGIVGSHDKAKGIVPGVTIGRSGSIGNTQYFDSEYFPLNTTLYVTDFLGNHPKFVYYFFKRFDFSAFDSGSVQPSLNRNFLYTAIINKPGLADQKAIAHILSTLDDKIEINKKSNETLEGIAKGLFKSWFIDFDPVKAKAEGRSTGLPDEISDLFPDSFEDSVSTLIPAGWKKKNFGDFVIPKRGKIITQNTVTEGPIPVVAGGLNPSYFHNEHNVEGPVVTISGSGANAGFVNLYFDNIWASDCSYISKTESKNTFTAYLFLKTFQKRVFATQHGAAQPHVDPNDLIRLEFIFPNLDIFDKFEYLVNPLFQKIHVNSEAKKNLEIMRNILLPKLISGELRIPDAEEMIEELGI